MGQAAKRVEMTRQAFVPLTNNECLIIDDDTREEEDLLQIIATVEGLGFTPRHAQRIGDVADALVEYRLKGIRPAVILVDVYIPDWPDNFGLLGFPEVTIDDVNIAGIILYEKVILKIEGIKDCPVIFISNHKDIASLPAHRLRMAGHNCMFLSKDDFREGSQAFLQPLISRKKSEIPKEGFYDEDYEVLWDRICEIFELTDREKFSCLGAKPGSNVDLLRYIKISDDADKRINTLANIAFSLKILYPDRKDMKQAINARDLFHEDSSLREIIGRGDLTELRMAQMTLEKLCGAR